MRQHEQGGAVDADQICAHHPKKYITHVHHAGVAQREVELLLRNSYKPDKNDVSNQQQKNEPGPMPGCFWH